MSVIAPQRVAPPDRSRIPIRRYMSERHNLSGRLGLLAVVIFQCLFILPPVIYLIWRSFNTGGSFGESTHLSLDSYRAVFASADTVHMLIDTLIFSIGSSLLAVVLGVAVAWLVARTNTYGKSLSYAAAFIGLAIPGMLRIIGWLLLLNPQNGLINQFLRASVGFGSGASFENMFGMIVLEAMLWVPMGFLLMIGPMRAMDGGLEEASLMCGAPMRRTYRRVTLRLLAPAIASVCILAFIRVVQSFEVALFVGSPARIPIWGAQIYRSVTDSPLPDYGVASAYATLMLAGLGVALFLYNRLLRNANRFSTVSGSGYRQRVIDLGRWRWVGTVLMAAIFLFELLPAAYMVVVSFMPRLSGDLWGKGSPGWSFANYRNLWAANQLVQSLTNSLIIAVVTATTCVLLAVATSWFYARSKMRFHRLPDALAQLPMVVPGIVMGLAILIIYLRVPIGVYGTIWIIVIAFVPALGPFAVRYVQPALVQLSSQLTEQAQISGGSAFYRLRKVLLPLLGPALLGSWILICVTALRELSVASLLSTQSSPVAATTMLALWVNGSVNELAAFGTIVMTISVVIAAAGYRLLRGVGVHV